MDDTSERVGDRIRKLRERMGLTQEEFARRAKMSKGFLSDVENDKRKISAEYLLRIASELGASVDYLLRGEIAGHKVSNEPLTIPHELTVLAEERNLSYSEIVQLLQAHNSVVARRSETARKRLTVDDWRELHKTIKRVFDA